MGITSLRRHLYPQVVKATTIADVMGEPMHPSGLTMREYNEIAKEVSKMSDKDILESVNDINKATTVAVLEPVNGEDIKRWEEESPAVKEDNENGKETNEKGKEETQGNEENEVGFSDLVENKSIEPVQITKKKRVYKRKVVIE